MRIATDLVKDSKLKTQYRDGITRHVIESSDRRHGHRKIKKDQRWQRGEVLGEGAFGIVWKETLVGGESDAKFRAVKCIRKRVGNSDTLDYSRELEAIAKFSRGKYKSFFVESYGWFADKDHVFITMEYCENGDLQQYMSKIGKMPEHDVRTIAFQILEGVYEMHDNGFAHRDLKPSNILIRRLGDDEDGGWWIKIGDFGISKRAEEGMTALRTVGGTEGFLAPEVLVGKGSLFVEKTLLAKLLGERREYTFAVDIWALGEITYRALCGASPLVTDLAAYVNGTVDFPTNSLRTLKASEDGIDFIQELMKVLPGERLTASEALDHAWFDELRDASPRSSGEFQSVDENHMIRSDMLSPAFDTGTSGSFGPDCSESAPWTDLDAASGTQSVPNLSHIPKPSRSSIELRTQRDMPRTASQRAGTITERSIAMMKKKSYQAYIEDGTSVYGAHNPRFPLSTSKGIHTSDKSLSTSGEWFGISEEREQASVSPPGKERARQNEKESKSRIETPHKDYQVLAAKDESLSDSSVSIVTSRTIRDLLSQPEVPVHGRLAESETTVDSGSNESYAADNMQLVLLKRGDDDEGSESDSPAQHPAQHRQRRRHRRDCDCFDCSSDNKINIYIHSEKQLLRVFLVEPSGKIWITWVEELPGAQLDQVPTTKISNPATIGDYPMTENSRKDAGPSFVPPSPDIYYIPGDWGRERVQSSARDRRAMEDRQYIKERGLDGVSREQRSSSNSSLDEKVLHEAYFQPRQPERKYQYHYNAAGPSRTVLYEPSQTRHRSPSPLARPPIGVNRPLESTERQRIRTYTPYPANEIEVPTLRRSHTFYGDSHINSPQHGAQGVKDTERKLRTQKKEPSSRTSGFFKAMRPSYKKKENTDDVNWDQSRRSLNRQIYGSSDDNEGEGNRSDSDNSSLSARKPSSGYDMNDVKWNSRTFAREPVQREDDERWERGGNRNRNDMFRTVAILPGQEDKDREDETRGRDREKKKILKKRKNRMTVSPLTEHVSPERERRYRDGSYARPIFTTKVYEY